MSDPRATTGGESAAPDADPADGRSRPAQAQEDARVRTQERQLALRRATFFALTLLAAALSVRAIVGEKGLLEVHRSGAELARLSADVQKWRDRNAGLEDRIHALRADPGAIEAIARERLGWVRPGEVTYLFPQDPAALEPGDPGAVPPGEFAPTTGGEETDDEADADSAPTATPPPAAPAPPHTKP